MRINITISAIETGDGKFLPKFDFIEYEGNQVTCTPYHFGEDSIRDTREEALHIAKVNANSEAVKKYGRGTEIFIKEE